MMATLKLSPLQELEAQASLKNKAQSKLEKRAIEREELPHPTKQIVEGFRQEKPKNYYWYNLHNHGGKNGSI